MYKYVHLGGNNEEKLSSDRVYSSTNRKKYTKRIKRSDGTYLSCVCYGSEEFVCWLNRKCLNNGEDPATIIKKNIDDSQMENVERILF